MGICNQCGHEGTRIRSRWLEGIQLPDECPNCAPTSFEKFSAPSDKKIWMGYEAHPNEYVRSADGGYDRKPEYRTEQEERLRNETEEERNTRLRAESRKRSARRTAQMDSVEFHSALRRAAEIAEWIEGSAEQGVDVN